MRRRIAIYHPDGLAAAKLLAEPGQCVFCEAPLPGLRRVVCGSRECERAMNTPTFATGAAVLPGSAVSESPVPSVPKAVDDMSSIGVVDSVLPALSLSPPGTRAAAGGSQRVSPLRDWATKLVTTGGRCFSFLCCVNRRRLPNTFAQNRFVIATGHHSR